MKTVDMLAKEQPPTTAKRWTIELTDLGVHQGFMGYSLSDKYLLIGITSPLLESQISINSLSHDEQAEIKIPLQLEKCSALLNGSIWFKGLDKILPKWEIHFVDNRFGESVKIDEQSVIRIRELEKNIRSEHMKLLESLTEDQHTSSFFELSLKPKVKHWS